MKSQMRQFDDQWLVPLVRKTRPDIAPTDEFTERVRRRVFASVPGQSKPAKGKGRRLWRFGRIGPAVAACFAIIIGVAVFLAPPEQARADFAMVIKKIAEVNSVSYTKTWSIPGHKSFSSPTWAKRPGLVRAQMEDGRVFITDFRSGKEMTIVPQTKKVFFNEAHKEAGDDILDRLSHLNVSDAQYIGREVVVGEETEKYVVRSAQGTITIWAQPQTNLPVLIKSDAPDCSYVIEDIKWNPDLSPDLFALNAPEGYKIDDPAGEASEKALIDLLNGTVAIANKYPISLDAEGVLAAVRTEAPKKAIDGVGLSNFSGKDPRIKPYWANAKRAIAYAAKLRQNGDIHYRGDIVKPGATRVPVCWWKENKNEANWRVYFSNAEVANLSDQQLLRLT